jgi:hypothetical protein
VNITAKKYCTKQIKGGDNPNKIFMNQGSDVEYIVTPFQFLICCLLLPAQVAFFIIHIFPIKTISPPNNNTIPVD